MNPLHHGDAGLGRQFALCATIALAAALGWIIAARSPVRCGEPRTGLRGCARTYVESLPALGAIDIVLGATNGFGTVDSATAAVGALGSIVMLAVIAGAAVFVLDGAPVREVEIR